MLYCDRCHTSYPDGTRCPACGAALTPREREEEEDLVPVLRTSDPSFLPVAQSVLEAAGIPYVIQGGETAGLFPLGPFGRGLFRDGLGASILVPREREEEARELLRGCNSSEAPE